LESLLTLTTLAIFILCSLLVALIGAVNLKEFGCIFTKLVIFLEDNIAAIHLSKNPGDFSKSMHIDTRYHFVREQVAAG